MSPFPYPGAFFTFHPRGSWAVQLDGLSLGPLWTTHWLSDHRQLPRFLSFIGTEGMGWAFPLQIIMKIQ